MMIVHVTDDHVAKQKHEREQATAKKGRVVHFLPSLFGFGSFIA